MSAWRRKAIEAVPDARADIERAPTPMAAWIDLYFLFVQAAGAGDRPLCRRILSLARDNLAARHPDVFTAVALAFIEHLADDASVLALLPELISKDEALGWRSLMAYHHTPGQDGIDARLDLARWDDPCSQEATTPPPGNSRRGR